MLPENTNTNNATANGETAMTARTLPDPLTANLYNPTKAQGPTEPWSAVSDARCIHCDRKVTPIKSACGSYWTHTSEFVGCIDALFADLR